MDFLRSRFFQKLFWLYFLHSCGVSAFNVVARKRWMLVGSSKPLVSKLPDFAEIQAAVHTMSQGLRVLALKWRNRDTECSYFESFWRHRQFATHGEVSSPELGRRLPNYHWFRGRHKRSKDKIGAIETAKLVPRITIYRAADRRRHSLCNKLIRQHLYSLSTSFLLQQYHK